MALTVARSDISDAVCRKVALTFMMLRWGVCVCVETLVRCMVVDFGSRVMAPTAKMADATVLLLACLPIRLPVCLSVCECLSYPT
jgi:hypothetical protein